MKNARTDNSAACGQSRSTVGLGGEWTDPRPQYPVRGAIVVVLCKGGHKRYATHEYDGWRKFPGGMLGRWSMADPEIIGWKRANWPPTTDEEKEAAGMATPNAELRGRPLADGPA